VFSPANRDERHIKAARPPHAAKDTRCHAALGRLRQNNRPEIVVVGLEAAPQVSARGYRNGAMFHVLHFIIVESNSTEKLTFLLLFATYSMKYKRTASLACNHDDMHAKPASDHTAICFYLLISSVCVFSTLRL